MLRFSPEFPGVTSSEPTLYVIGGLPRTGKTTVASRLAYDLRISNLETDHIRLLFSLFPRSILRPGPHSPIDKVTKKLRPGLECLIDAILTSGSSMVINGECIDPRMVTESPYRHNIRSCFLGLDDPDATFRRIRDVNEPTDWATTKPDTELNQILHSYARRSKVLRALCCELGLPYVDASRDFKAANNATYEILA